MTQGYWWGTSFLQNMKLFLQTKAQTSQQYFRSRSCLSPFFSPQFNVFLGEPGSTTARSPSGPTSSVWQCPAEFSQKDRPQLHNWKLRYNACQHQGPSHRDFLCMLSQTQRWRGSWRCNTCVCTHARTHTILSVHPSLDQTVLCLIIKHTVSCALPQAVLPDWNVL